MFDYVLQHGLGYMVVDFVWEICANPTMASSDPLEAYLMDWQCLRDWSKEVLIDTRKDLQQQLAANLPSEILALAASRLQARMTQLEPILKILASPNNDHAVATDALSLQDRLVSDIDYCEGQQLQMCIKVFHLLMTLEVDLRDSAGRHGSHQEWRRTVDQRKDAAGSQPLFLMTLLARLADQGMKAMAYPPSSLGAAVKTVFLNNTSKLTTSNQHARLALLQYLLLDLGVPLTPSTFRTAFGVATADFHCWHAAFLLDESCTKNSMDGSANVDEACSLLSGAAGGSMPLSFPAVLAARGRANAALMVLRASSGAQELQTNSPFEDDVAGSDGSHAPAMDGTDPTSSTPQGLMGLTGRPRQSKGPAAAAAAAGISSRPGTQEAAEGAAESSWSRARRLRRTKLEVQVRLQAGLMQEALGCTHLAVSSCSPENRTRWAGELVEVMLLWAEEAHMLGKILQLPFQDSTELAVIAWLEARLQDSSSSAAQLPLFYLMRGRLPEATQAHQSLCSSDVSLSQEQALQLNTLLMAAATISPLANVS
ncbi:hypothetical protein WJX84_012262 [Apatococcus fuscideae]|uniref:ELYS-like domain-containing protein n=1 Tax=Apatococcus fuscideae TaxID=2026836 RepID=A0AAW1SNH4_9CHLO